MNALPANLPNIANAKLPETYERAKTTMAECSRIDECWDWANKAEALASYAKQADDDTLLTMATRIKARAIRRCGELYQQLPPALGGRPATEKPMSPGAQVSRSQVAREVGMSPRQKNTALRVANIPPRAFEAAVESEKPPTVKALAAMGTQRRPVNTDHLQGRDPKEFARATEAQGHLRRLEEFAASMDPELIARGTLPHERRPMQKRIDVILPWLGALSLMLDEARAT